MSDEQVSESEAGTVCSWTDSSNYSLDWNGPVNRPFAAFPVDVKSRPIIELLEAVVSQYPDRIALAESQQSTTYAGLWRAVASLAEQITGATAPKELVGILAPTTAAFPIGMLACMAAGRPFVAIDPCNPVEWLERVLDDVLPTLLLVADAKLVEVHWIPNDIRIICVNDHRKDAATNWQPTCLGPDEAACVLFTSGSTGLPKGIVNSQRNLLQRVSQSINSAHINSHDRLLTLASLCTIVGVRDLITALLTGASVRLLDTQDSSAREILRVIRDERISILFSFPALLRTIVQSSWSGAGEYLRLVRIGGDTTLWNDIALLRNWTAPGTYIQLIYAATEAPMMQWFISEDACATNDRDARIPIGYPLAGNAVAVLDERGESVREGEVGELVVRSQYVALGTWSRKQSVAGQIQVDATDQSMRLLRTGDLVRRRPDGLYDRLGRKDRQVKIRGSRVELDGVEAEIRRHAAVRDVAVIVRTDWVGNDSARTIAPGLSTDNTVRLVAYVQLHDGAPQGSLREIEAMMRHSVPSCMQPWRYYAAAAIPRLRSSKLDSIALHATDGARREEESEVCVDVRNDVWMDSEPVATLVAKLWRDLLAVDAISAQDDFFALGGDSLRAITMITELEKSLGRELPISWINEAPTFAAFCTKVSESTSVAYSPLVVLKVGEQLPPLFFIHGVGGGVTNLFAVARRMTWSGPVIGIQARGLNRRDKPHRTIAQMAEEYLRALKSRQPVGPYLLCGYSFGGLVAFELARRLVDLRDQVAFVGLIDTMPPQHHLLRSWTWAAFAYRSLAQRVRRKMPGIGWRALWASATYRPGAYSGELTLFEPSQRDLGLPSSAHHWAAYATAIQRHTLQGHHADMLNGENAAGAAEVLSHCIEAAIEQKELRVSVVAQAVHNSVGSAVPV